MNVPVISAPDYFAGDVKPNVAKHEPLPAECHTDKGVPVVSIEHVPSLHGVDLLAFGKGFEKRQG